jgi:hypothetical protein
MQFPVNNKVLYIIIITVFQSCSYGNYGNGNKSRDILLKPGIRWKKKKSTHYYLNGTKAHEGKFITYAPPGGGCLRFAYKMGIWKYWDAEGNLVWTETHQFKKRTALLHENQVIINELPDSLQSILDSLFYNK